MKAEKIAVAYRTETATVTKFSAADGELLVSVHQRTDNGLWVVSDFTQGSIKVQQLTNRTDAEAVAGRRFRKIHERKH